MSDLPELLCPAGDSLALDAAIDGGADAIYFGASAFNARANAKNFSDEEMRDAVARCHSYGVRAYITLNTLVYDRELSDFIRTAEKIYSSGADAVIVADVGGASLISKYIPELPLHASTQMSVHNSEYGERLLDLGFSRAVLAREMSLENIKSFISKTPIETEVFIHGALCVCCSGQCLFSSLVGGRSGNRGECAQPCRLPYKSDGNKYPLSLKDLCLAEHINELIDAKITSLKIEGRMKSPEYVRAVVGVWRKLLDERRNADKAEMKYLSDVFSRGGFTDGYFTSRINSSMMGIRSEQDKLKTQSIDSFKGLEKKVLLDMDVKIKRNEAAQLSVTAISPSKNTQKTAHVCGEIPFEAINAPLSRESVKKCLTKLGSTPYAVHSFSLELDEGLMMPVSALNALRRQALAKLIETDRRNFSIRDSDLPVPSKRVLRSKTDIINTARFYSPEQIPLSAREFFSHIYLPLEKYDGSVDGVILPSVIYDSELSQIRNLLSRAKKLGAKHLLAGNVGHFSLAEEFDLELHGDFRLNVCNSFSAEFIYGLGASDVILSPELKLPQIRDIGGAASVIIYGRVPLMILEKCIVGELVPSKKSDVGCEICQNKKVVLCDRRDAKFPILREYPHRSVVYNSVATYMADRERQLCDIGANNRHFIFSDETREECEKIIRAYQNGEPSSSPNRRI